MRKYKKGKLVKSVAEFEESEKEWYVVQYGKNSKTTHRAFLESWQYRGLKIFIDNKRIYEAERVNESEELKQELWGMDSNLTIIDESYGERANNT